MLIIYCYSPTNVSFYQEIQSYNANSNTIDDIPAHNINSKIGPIEALHSFVAGTTETNNT